MIQIQGQLQITAILARYLNESFRISRLVDSNYDRWNIPNVTKVEGNIVSDLITEDILDKYDILIIKTPKPYQVEEIKAIEKFVREGGGLFLVGEHSNFGGTSTALNEIGRNFGIEFEFDTVNGADNGLSTYVREGELPFARRGLSHSCLKYMPYFEFMTSCSIRILPLAEQVIRGYALLAEPGEYATSNFFRLTRADDASIVWDRNWGLFNQAVAVKHGKGRVVAFADSTTMSNYRAFFGGTPNLLAGVMEYLNRANYYSFFTPLFLVISFIFAAAVFYFFKREQRATAILIFIVVGSVAFSTAVAFFAQPIEDSLPSDYYCKNRTVCFDSEHSANMIKTNDIVDIENKKSFYNVFLVWTQRVNLTPFIGNLEESLDKGHVIIIIDPIKELSRREKDLIVAFLERGGRMLIMINGTDDSGKNLIKEFQFNLDIIEYNRSLQNTREPLPIEPWGPSIIGGESVKQVGNRTILARSSYGKGEVIIFVPSYVFKDGFNGNPGYMGSLNTIPNELNLSYDIQELYDLEFFIFEDVLKTGGRKKSNFDIGSSSYALGLCDSAGGNCRLLAE